jgi:hypothetical protein
MAQMNTANYGWPVPDKEGIQQTEIARIATALASADGKVKEIDVALAAQIAAFNAHTHTFASLTAKPTTLAGYGITDAYTKGAVDTAISAAIANLVGNAPEAIDTVYELAAALNDDPNFATTITALIGQKLAKDQNLNDLPDKATARANLGADAAYLGKTAKAADSAKLNGKADTAFATAAQGTKADNALPASSQAVDSAKLGGLAPDATATGNTIVQRAPAGYIYGSYFNASHPVSAPAAATAIMYEAANDGFLRKGTPAAVAAILGVLGVGQTWQDMTAARLGANTVYRNISGRPIQLAIRTTGILTVSTDNVNWVTLGSGHDDGQHWAIIPHGYYYRVSGGTPSIWSELR